MTVVSDRGSCTFMLCLVCIMNFAAHIMMRKSLFEYTITIHLFVCTHELQLLYESS